MGGREYARMDAWVNGRMDGLGGKKEEKERWWY